MSTETDIPLPVGEPPIQEIAASIGEGINLPPVDAHGASTGEAAQAGTGPLSPAGEPFNASVHVSLESINKDGRYRRKKGAPKLEGNYNATATPNNQQPNASAENCGPIIVGLFVGIGCAVCGRDFAPENQKEMDGLLLPTNDLLAKYQVKNIPPEVAIILAYAGYAAAKFAAKEACRKTFAEKVLGPLREWWKKRKAK